MSQDEYHLKVLKIYFVLFVGLLKEFTIFDCLLNFKIESFHLSCYSFQEAIFYLQRAAYDSKNYSESCL